MQQHRRRLIETIRLQGLPSPDGITPLPLVSLEDFFVGNEDFGSIGCNLTKHPGPQGFYRVLKAVRQRPDVLDVLVEIHEVEEGDESMWPFSDRVYILTSAQEKTVEEWVAELQPDTVEEGWAAGRPKAAPMVELPCRVWAVWWD